MTTFIAYTRTRYAVYTYVAMWPDSKHNFLSVGLNMICPPFKASIWYFFAHVINELAAGERFL